MTQETEMLFLQPKALVSVKEHNNNLGDSDQSFVGPRASSTRCCNLRGPSRKLPDISEVLVARVMGISETCHEQASKQASDQPTREH